MKKNHKQIQDEIDQEEMMKSTYQREKSFDFESFKFESLEDFEEYNRHVRAYNRKCVNPKSRMKIKVPDESFHKKIKVKFQKFEQPENIQKVRVRNKLIDWSGQLKSGCIYHLPVPVVNFLNNLAVPIFEEVKVENNGQVLTETKQVGERNRFSCNVLEFA